jgi:transcriptional regulator with XRE-family HTH domain
MSFETGTRIKKIREFRSYTQEHMAEKLDISQNTYSKIENGMSKLSTDRLEQIANVLDVPVDSILNNERQIINFNNSNGHIENGYVENMNHDKEAILKSFSILQQQFEIIKQQNEMLIKAIAALTKKL